MRAVTGSSRAVLLVVFLWASAAIAAAGQIRGVVVDQAGLTVPGATVELRARTKVLESTVSSNDGTFAFTVSDPDGVVVVSLLGFETISVPLANAGRIELALAGVTERTTVSVTDSREATPTDATIGRAIRTETAQRLPTARQHVLDALPLLPSVVRGPDGLLQIDGARPHEAPLLVDGFNVTDPATGVSAIDLPLESVSRVDVLRDPAAVTFAGALGPLVSLETRTGGDRFEFGAQGFVPRLRYGSGGFGRVEGLFPRTYAGGQSRDGRLRYFASGEFDYERIRVPGITAGPGSPDTREVSATVFGRADLQLSARHSLTAEGIYFPGRTSLSRLSPLRQPSSAPTLDNRDVFLGVTDRFTLSTTSLLKIRVGILSHATTVSPTSNLPAEINPLGWAGASFSRLTRTATRLSASVAWERSHATATGMHTVTVESALEDESLNGTVDERPVSVRDATGVLLRRLEFGSAATLAASARHLGLAVRDNWRVTDVLQVDAGARVDWSDLGGGVVPSARLGMRYLFGDRRTTVSGTVGRFVGAIPLSVPAFAGFPLRRDTTFDPAGAIIGSAVFTPTLAALALPRSWVATARVERHLAPGWDLLVSATQRRSSRLATVDVRADTGFLTVGSTGRTRYREIESALRHMWGEGNEAFVSYTRSSARGEINDFSTLFSGGDTEILRPGARGRLPADAPNRWLGWLTLSLSKGFILAPVVEWHSGFPYSPLTAGFDYATKPNTAAFPSFFSLDLGVFKTLTLRGRRLKTGIQVFNATNHFNPRDVYAVPGTARFGSFTNSVGPTLRGVLTFTW